MKRIYVVIVGQKENLGVGCSHPLVFTSTDKETAIKNALEQRTAMERKNGTIYDVFIGEVTHRISVLVSYELVALETN